MPVKSKNMDIWVFGYGSLIWSPCFEYKEKFPAYLRGYHRKLCVLSHGYRGTPGKPGLVFGLDIGGSCHGLAFRIGEDQVRDALGLIRSRELSSNVYKEKLVVVALADGRKVHALAYIVDRRHPKYITSLDADEIFDFVRDASGASGSNSEYIVNTFSSISALGLSDKNLKSLSEKLLSYMRSSG